MKIRHVVVDRDISSGGVTLQIRANASHIIGATIFNPKYFDYAFVERLLPDGRLRIKRGTNSSMAASWKKDDVLYVLQDVKGEK